MGRVSDRGTGDGQGVAVLASETPCSTGARDVKPHTVNMHIAREMVVVDVARGRQLRVANRE